MRLVDDYIFISTSELEARHFFSIMEEGDRRNILTLNRSKTMANFGIDCVQSPIVNDWFPWCGIELNVYELSVRPCFRR